CTNYEIIMTTRPFYTVRGANDNLPQANQFIQMRRHRKISKPWMSNSRGIYWDDDTQLLACHHDAAILCMQPNSTGCIIYKAVPCMRNLLKPNPMAPRFRIAT